MITPSKNQDMPARVQVHIETLVIRRMRETDVNDIMEIESVSFGGHHWSDDSFLNEMKNQLGRYYVLIDTNFDQTGREKLVGYCGYWLILDEAHITTIATRPACRGASLGEIQLIQMMERCMGQSIKWITLEVRVSNYSAQNLYYKYGFQSAGIRRKYYQDNNEDALIMTTPDIASKMYRALYNEKKQALKERLGSFPQGFGMS